MNFKKILTKSVKDIVKFEAKSTANSTTCGVLYQPKAPVALKKFSKIENDK